MRLWHRYLVEWDNTNYIPSWEAWRVQEPGEWEIPDLGGVGDPIRTWEPSRMVRNTEALQEWKKQGEG